MLDFLNRHHKILQISPTPFFLNISTIASTRSVAVNPSSNFPFISTPPSSYCANNKSMLNQRDFAYQELLRLEKLGCISRVEVHLI